jgi:hypothetical protein
MSFSLAQSWFSIDRGPGEKGGDQPVPPPTHLFQVQAYVHLSA